MKIYVNNKEHEVSGERPLIDELHEIGFDIPSLCYSGNAHHQASCMVCMVKNAANGQMIPSCSTFPTEGMKIETSTEEVEALRKLSLELLLSDHRADCEAPCTIVCQHGLDPAQILLYFDRGMKAEARSLLASSCDISNPPCNECKAPCEKACRRGTVDKCVSIKDIITQLAADTSLPTVEAHSKANVTKGYFGSKLGRYTAEEMEWLKAEYADESHCLHCACEGRDKCKLREYSAKAGIKSSRFGVSSNLPVKEQVKVAGRLCFEPAKCIRCGLCVYNTKDGFTFQHRGFSMQVMIPEESKSHIDEDIAMLCPTGALFLTE